MTVQWRDADQRFDLRSLGSLALRGSGNVFVIGRVLHTCAEIRDTAKIRDSNGIHHSSNLHFN